MGWNEYQVASARRANEELVLRAQLNSHAALRREVDAIREQLTELVAVMTAIKQQLGGNNE